MTELIMESSPPSIMVTEAMDETNISGVTNQCIVCQVDSMEQDCQKVKLAYSECKLIDRYIKCDSCHIKICTDCIRGLYSHIENNKFLHPSQNKTVSFKPCIE